MNDFRVREKTTLQSVTFRSDLIELNRKHSLSYTVVSVSIDRTKMPTLNKQVSRAWK